MRVILLVCAICAYTALYGQGTGQVKVVNGLVVNVTENGDYQYYRYAESVRVLH